MAQISPAFIGAIPCYKAGSEDYLLSDFEGWEHLRGLEMLELWPEEDSSWDGCPQFLSLKRLILRGDLVPPLSDHIFPALESVEIGLGSLLVPFFLKDMEGMFSIRNISLQARGLD